MLREIASNCFVKHVSAPGQVSTLLCFGAGPLSTLRRPLSHLAIFRCRAAQHRSEEHTSELQSLAYLVCRLLLEKKKNDGEGSVLGGFSRTSLAARALPRSTLSSS